VRGDTYRATVTRVSTDGVWFKAEARWPGMEFGPCPLLANTVRAAGQTTSGTAVGDHGTHTHTTATTQLLPDLIEAGDSILITDLNREDFVVLGVIRTGVS
jgi:hypothetical protein